MRTIDSLKTNEVIIINSMEEYSKIAVLLDKAGKRWSLGHKYCTWSPMINSVIFKNFPIYINVYIGLWANNFSKKDYIYTQASEFFEKKLPKYWAVDISKDRVRGKETVIKYLNEVYKQNWGGNSYNLYGYNGRNSCLGTDVGFLIQHLKNNPTLLTIDEFITYPEVRKVLELDKETELTTKEMKDTRFPFALTMDKAKRIMAVVCPDWQERLGKLWGKSLLIYGYVEVDETLYREGRAAANEKVNKVLDEIFGKDEQVITYEDVMKQFKKISFTVVNGSIKTVSARDLNDSQLLEENNAYSEAILLRQQAQLKLANTAKYLNKDKINSGVYLFLRDGEIKHSVYSSRIGESVIFFKTEDLAKQAIEILGEETIKLACQPLND